MGDAAYVGATNGNGAGGATRRPPRERRRQVSELASDIAISFDQKMSQSRWAKHLMARTTLRTKFPANREINREFC